MFVMAKATLLSIIKSYSDSLGPASKKIKLFQNPLTLTAETVLSDFTVADYTGYADVTVTGFSLPAWQGQGAGVIYSQPMAVFQPTGTTTTNIIYGYYFTLGGTPDTYVGGEVFPSPIPMASTTDQIIIVLPLGISDAGIPGQSF